MPKRPWPSPLFENHSINSSTLTRSLWATLWKMIYGRCASSIINASTQLSYSHIKLVLPTEGLYEICEFICLMSRCVSLMCFTGYEKTSAKWSRLGTLQPVIHLLKTPWLHLILCAGIFLINRNLKALLQILETRIVYWYILWHLYIIINTGLEEGNRNNLRRFQNFENYAIITIHWMEDQVSFTTKKGNWNRTTCCCIG